MSFRIKKDLRFNRNRAFKQLEFLKIECDDSSYYSQRCIDVASSTLTSRLVNQNSRFLNRRTIAIDPDKKKRHQRCIDVASNTLTSRLVNQNSRFLNRRAIAIDPDKIRREADGTFTVPSETKEDVEYSVDMDLRICSM